MKYNLENLPELPHMHLVADKILSDVDSFVTVCEETFKDTGFSLEARWALYLKVEKLLPTDNFMSHALSILTDSPYDDLYMERYQLSYNSDIDERLEENYDPNADDLDEYSEKSKRLYAKRDEWREAVLAEGYGGFVFDW